MNFQFLIGLFKGKNVIDTIAKILLFGSGLLAGLDTNKTGNDDLIANIMVSSSEGLTAYNSGNYNLAGKLIDGIMAALEQLKKEWLESGIITPVNHKEEEKRE